MKLSAVIVLLFAGLSLSTPPPVKAQTGYPSKVEMLSRLRSGNPQRILISLDIIEADVSAKSPYVDLTKIAGSEPPSQHDYRATASFRNDDVVRNDLTLTLASDAGMILQDTYSNFIPRVLQKWLTGIPVHSDAMGRKSRVYETVSTCGKEFQCILDDAGRPESGMLDEGGGIRLYCRMLLPSFLPSDKFGGLCA